MAALKYSRQREAIKHYLASTKEHPTADTVYMHVKKEFPNISLGTVYRNLNLLTDIGEAIKISTPDGGDRFDGTVQPHNHFLCTKCGRLLDLELDMKSIEEMNRLANDCFDGMITSSSTLFYGECSDCIRKSYLIFYLKENKHNYYMKVILFVILDFFGIILAFNMLNDFVLQTIMLGFFISLIGTIDFIDCSWEYLLKNEYIKVMK